MVKFFAAAAVAFAAVSFFSTPVAVADDFEKESIETVCEVRGFLFDCQTYSFYAPETMLSVFSTPFICPFKGGEDEVVEYTDCLEAGKDYALTNVNASNYAEYVEMAKSVIQYRMNDAALEEARLKFLNVVLHVGDYNLGTNNYERSEEFIAVAMPETMG